MSTPSSLAAQLALHRAAHPAPKPLDARRSDRPLIVHGEHERLDPRELLDSGLNGLMSLMRDRPELKRYHAALFSPGIGSEPNSELHMLPKSVRERVEADAVNLAWELSPWLLRRDAQCVLEFLLCRYQLHLVDPDAAFGPALPYHDTILFDKLIAIPNPLLSTPDTNNNNNNGNNVVKWRFLTNFKPSRTKKEQGEEEMNPPRRLTRASLVKASLADGTLFEFVFSSLVNRLEAPALLAAWGVEAINTANAFQMERVVLPSVMKNLPAALGGAVQNRSATCVMLTALFAKSPVAPSVTEAVEILLMRRCGGNGGDEVFETLVAIFEIQSARRIMTSPPGLSGEVAAGKAAARKICDEFYSRLAGGELAFPPVTHSSALYRAWQAHAFPSTSSSPAQDAQTEEKDALVRLLDARPEIRREAVRTLPCEEIFAPPVESSVGVMLLRRDDDRAVVEELLRTARESKFTHPAVRDAAITLAERGVESAVAYLLACCGGGEEASSVDVSLVGRLLKIATPSALKAAESIGREWLTVEFDNNNPVLAGNEGNSQLEALSQLFPYNPAYIANLLDDALAQFTSSSATKKKVGKKSTSTSAANHVNTTSSSWFSRAFTCLLEGALDCDVVPCPAALARTLPSLPPTHARLILKRVLSRASTRALADEGWRGLLRSLVEMDGKENAFRTLLATACDDDDDDDGEQHTEEEDGTSSSSSLSPRWIRCARALRMSAATMRQSPPRGLSPARAMLVTCGLLSRGPQEVRRASIEWLEAYTNKAGLESHPFAREVLRRKTEAEADGGCARRVLRELIPRGTAEDFALDCLSFSSELGEGTELAKQKCVIHLTAISAMLECAPVSLHFPEKFVRLVILDPAARDFVERTSRGKALFASALSRRLPRRGLALFSSGVGEDERFLVELLSSDSHAASSTLPIASALLDELTTTSTTADVKEDDDDTERALRSLATRAVFEAIVTRVNFPTHHVISSLTPFLRLAFPEDSYREILATRETALRTTATVEIVLEAARLRSSPFSQPSSLNSLVSCVLDVFDRASTCEDGGDDGLARNALAALERLLAEVVCTSRPEAARRIVRAVCTTPTADVTRWSALRCLRACEPSEEDLAMLLDGFASSVNVNQPPPNHLFAVHGRRAWSEEVSSDALSLCLACFPRGLARIHVRLTASAAAACVRAKTADSRARRALLSRVLKASKTPAVAITCLLRRDVMDAQVVENTESDALSEARETVELCSVLPADRQLSLVADLASGPIGSTRAGLLFVRELLRSNQFLRALVERGEGDLAEEHAEVDVPLYLGVLDALLALFSEAETGSPRRALLDGCFDALAAVLSIELLLKVVGAMLADDEERDVVELALRLLRTKCRDEAQEWGREELDSAIGFVAQLARALEENNVDPDGAAAAARRRRARANSSSSSSSSSSATSAFEDGDDENDEMDVAAGAPGASARALGLLAPFLANKRPSPFAKAFPVVVRLACASGTPPGLRAHAHRCAASLAAALQSRSVPYLAPLIPRLLSDALPEGEFPPESDMTALAEAAREALAGLLESRLALLVANSTEHVEALAKLCALTPSGPARDALLRPLVRDVDLGLGLRALVSMREPLYPAAVIESLVTSRMTWRDAQTFTEELRDACVAYVEAAEDDRMSDKREESSGLIVAVALLSSERQLRAIIEAMIEAIGENERKGNALVMALRALVGRLGELFVPVFPLSWMLKRFKSATSREDEEEEDDDDEQSETEDAEKGKRKHRSSKEKTRKKKRRREMTRETGVSAEVLEIVDCLAEFFHHARGSEAGAGLSESEMRALNSIIVGTFPRVRTPEEERSVGNLAVAYSRALDSPESWRLLHRMLAKTMREKGSSSRLVALGVLAALFKGVGSEYAALLPDTLPLLSEALEDEDEGVREAARELARIMTRVTGQDVGEYL